MAKFNEDDLDIAIANLSICKFFPADAAARAAIRMFLVRICPDAEALDWLVRTVMNRIGEWPGPLELRAILCTKFRPADGIEADSTIKGLTPSDAEERQLEQHAQIKAGGWVPDDEEAKKLLGGLVDRKKWLQ